jgi:hypothetical protein
MNVQIPPEESGTTSGMTLKTNPFYKGVMTKRVIRIQK